MLVSHFLEKSAQCNPDKVALICNNQRLSYAEINKMANRLANALKEYGIKRGDRVLLYLPNCVELTVAIFSIMKSEAVFVVIDPTTKPDKFLHIAKDCEASAVFLPFNRTELAHKISCGTDCIKFLVFTGENLKDNFSPNYLFLSFNEIINNFSDTPTECNLSNQDLACLIYTSGTTGEPKGVMSTHYNVSFAVSSIIKYLENNSDDIVINGLPLSFDYGLYQLLMVFKFGGTLVLERSFIYPAQFLKKIEIEKVTGLPGVPTFFSILLKMDLTQYDLSNLRYLTNTAAALSPNHIKDIQKKFYWAKLFSMYGLTETKRTLYLPPSQLNKRPNSVGLAIPGTEVWLEDPKGKRLGSDEIGELVICGDHVMQGYWNKPEATALRYKQCGITGKRICYSGDLFWRDIEGYYYFVSRKDDIIKSKGMKVAPKEIENVLYMLSDLIEAAVIGVSDPVLGQSIKAFVVLQTNSLLKERDILRHCKYYLEDHMVPHQIEFRESLPKNASGKIRKTELV